MIALIVGTALALAALAFVLYPLFRDALATRPVFRAPPAPVAAPEGAPAARAIDALREVEFDRATGKLSESDYAELKAAYTREALSAIRADDAAVAAISDDEIEAVILAYRVQPMDCVVCGPRPEADAAFCSSCGRYLAGHCRRCGATIDEPAARFCAACGAALAA